MENLVPSRIKMLENIEEELFDMIIIGGGITGGGVARDASLRGLKVALFEKSDFGSGTSMATSKMLHGGLRYLSNYEFRLVRHAALERKIHLEIAPHLAETMTFLLPYYTWMKIPKYKFRLGLILYDLLALPKGIGRHKGKNRKEMIEMLELLDNPNLTGGFTYNDVKTDDTRLTLANIMSAAAAGARTLNYCEVKSWNKEIEYNEVYVEDKIGNKLYTVKGKVLVICGGPWSEIIENRGMEFESYANLRLTRGTHVILKKKLGENPCLVVNDDERPIFIIPRMDYDLAGTTDLDYHGHPNDVVPTVEEVEYILDGCNKLFPNAKYAKSDVVASFVGLRPLIFEDGKNEGSVSRDHKIITDGEGVITVLGGKLTTYRRMAKEAVNHARKILGGNYVTKKSITDKLPLWGGEIDSWQEFCMEKHQSLRDRFFLPANTIEMLLHWYGSELDFFEQFLTECGTERIKKDRPWLKAQIIYACRIEFAQTPIDVLRRRLSIMLEEGNGLDILDDIITIMALELNWSVSISKQMKLDYIEYVKTKIQISGIIT